MTDMTAQKTNEEIVEYARKRRPIDRVGARFVVVRGIDALHVYIWREYRSGGRHTWTEVLPMVELQNARSGWRSIVAAAVRRIRGKMRKFFSEHGASA